MNVGDVLFLSSFTALVETFCSGPVLYTTDLFAVCLTTLSALSQMGNLPLLQLLLPPALPKCELKYTALQKAEASPQDSDNSPSQLSVRPSESPLVTPP